MHLGEYITSGVIIQIEKYSYLIKLKLYMFQRMEILIVTEEESYIFIRRPTITDTE